MRKRCRYSAAVLTAFLVVCTWSAAAQERSGNVEQDSARSKSDSLVSLAPAQRGVDPWRLSLIGGAALGTLGATYAYLEDTWWAEKPTSFHFDDGGDLKYAHNIDKLAHFYGGSIAADMFTRALLWSRVPERSAVWLGFGLGVFVQMVIELKDGFAPRWGYSVWDVGIGSAGALYYTAKHYFPALAATDVKFSYWQYSDKYFSWIKSGGGATWNDDYINQTYWLSFKVNSYLPSSSEKYWPDWLAVAIGVGVDDALDGYEKNNTKLHPGNLEIFLALDVDVTQILPSDNGLWETIKHYLNYIKFPAPAVRLTPTTVWYGLYF